MRARLLHGNKFDRSVWGLRIVLASTVSLVLAGCGPSPEPGAECPAILQDAHQLLLVTAENFNQSNATMTRYQRAGRDWRRVGETQTVVVGESGMGWGYPYRDRAGNSEPVKQEGDRRAPAGFYALGPTFGFSPSDAPGHLHLKPDVHYCVDEPTSKHYSRIVPRDVAGEGVSGEAMSEIALYRRGLVVEYPASGSARSGSCIFIHVWREPGYPTAGCVAMAEGAVAKLQTWVSSKSTPTVLGILPASAAKEFAGCLPGADVAATDP